MYGFSGGSSRSANVWKAEVKTELRYSPFRCDLRFRLRDGTMTIVIQQIMGEWERDYMAQRLHKRDNETSREYTVRVLGAFAVELAAASAGAICAHHFLRLGGIGNPTAASAVAAATELASDNLPLAALAGVSAELAQRYKHLSHNERAVIDLLVIHTQGGSIYKVWIAEDDLLKTMDPELDKDSRRRLLANMKSRGILEEGAGKWRAVW
jgi:hypothetical protein